MNICVDLPGAILTTASHWLACPTCRDLVKDEGFGLVSCELCDTIMMRSTAIVTTIRIS